VAYRTIALAFLLVLVGIGAAYPALAQVPRVYGQGAAASGMGNAFAAQADNPSALHYNPAGMTQLRGVQTMAGGTFVGGTSDFRSPTGISVTGDHDGAFAGLAEDLIELDDGYCAGCDHVS